MGYIPPQNEPGLWFWPFLYVIFSLADSSASSWVIPDITQALKPRVLKHYTDKRSRMEPVITQLHADSCYQERICSTDPARRTSSALAVQTAGFMAGEILA